MKSDILVSEESSYFSDYHSEILGPKYVSHYDLDVLNKKVNKFRKSVVTTLNIYTVFHGTAYKHFCC